MSIKIKENLSADLTYSSIDAVNALTLYACALHQWKFVEVNFWFFWRRSILQDAPACELFKYTCDNLADENVTKRHVVKPMVLSKFGPPRLNRHTHTSGVLVGH